MKAQNKSNYPYKGDRILYFLVLLTAPGTIVFWVKLDFELYWKLNRSFSFLRNLSNIDVAFSRSSVCKLMPSKAKAGN